ncbi:MAG: hypothetical protein QOE38_1301, partial [Thermoleophilaceae bacterium]|nr:hypothetical protein [Thermoleophilaceae bacterium]
SYGPGSLTGTVNGNTIGVPATANSGSLEGSGVLFRQEGGASGGSTGTLEVTNNNISQYNNYGIYVQGGAGVATGGNLNVNVTGNTLSNPGTNLGGVFQGIHFNSGVTQGDNFAECYNAKGNSAVGSGRGGGQDFRTRQRQNTTVRLPGYAGGNTDTTAVATFIANQNDANPNSSGAEAPVPSSGATTEITPPIGGGFVGGAACP